MDAGPSTIDDKRARELQALGAVVVAGLANEHSLPVSEALIVLGTAVGICLAGFDDEETRRGTLAHFQTLALSTALDMTETDDDEVS
jgi:hypothetical protein